MIYCEKCGARIPDDSEFCEACGARINNRKKAKRRAPEKEKSTGAGKIARYIPAAIIIIALGIVAALKTNAELTKAEEEVDSSVESVAVADDTNAVNEEVVDYTDEELQEDEDEEEEPVEHILTPEDLSDDIVRSMREKAEREITDYIDIFNHDKHDVVLGSAPKYLGLCVLDNINNDDNKVVLIYKANWKAVVDGLHYGHNIFVSEDAYYPVVFSSSDGYESFDTSWRSAFDLGRNGVSAANIHGYRTFSGLYTERVRNASGFVATPDDELRKLLPETFVAQRTGDVTYPASPGELTDDIRSRMTEEAFKLVSDYVERFNMYEHNAAQGYDPRYLGLYVMKANNGSDCDVILMYAVDWFAKEEGVVCQGEPFESATAYYPVRFRHVCMYPDGVEDYNWDATDSSWRQAYKLGKDGFAHGDILGFASLYDYKVEMIMKNDSCTAEIDDNLKAFFDESEAEFKANY